MMKRLVLALLIFSALLPALIITSSASRQSPIYDGDSLLSSDTQTIESALNSAKEATRVEFFVYIHSDGYASEYTMLSEFGVSDSDDVVLLEIELDRSVYYYELYTYGDAYSLISDSDADYILDTDEVYYNIKSGNLAEGILAFTSVTEEVLISARNAARISAIVWPIVIALISGGIAVTVVVVRYKKKLKSPSYPLSRYANMNLTYSNDAFLGSNVVRTRISSSSGRSGGRSGGSRGRR